jgi:hypothetical protein
LRSWKSNTFNESFAWKIISHQQEKNKKSRALIMGLMPYERDRDMSSLSVFSLHLLLSLENIRRWLFPTQEECLHQHRIC